MTYREGSTGRLAHIIGKAIPEGVLKRVLWRYYNKYVKFENTTREVEALIAHRYFRNGLLHICLENGVIVIVPQKAGSTYEMYREAYELLMEQFVMEIYEQNYQLQKGDTVVDVGAGWGFNTVGFSREVGNGGRVIAVEPDAGNLAVLRGNIELNRCTNVDVVGKGIWNQRDILPLQIKERRSGNSLVATKGKTVGMEKVQVDTLDNILEEVGISKVDLIKLDIEGAEIEALKGMDRTLNRNGARIVIAAYHVIDGQPTYKTIIAAMKAAGFISIFDSRNGIAYFEKK